VGGSCVGYILANCSSENLSTQGVG